jgi:hypothetical protein
MTTDACERYLQDPEANARHLEGCEQCRALFATLDASVRHDPIRVDALPLAAWEGASHRAWSLVIGAALGVAALAIALFLVVGESPIHQVKRAITASLPAEILVSMLRMFGGAVRSAPAAWQIAIGIGFVAVNAVLYMLLRRAPRGIDA